MYVFRYILLQSQNSVCVLSWGKAKVQAKEKSKYQRRIISTLAPSLMRLLLKCWQPKCQLGANFDYNLLTVMCICSSLLLHWNVCSDSQYQAEAEVKSQECFYGQGRWRRREGKRKVLKSSLRQTWVYASTMFWHWILC